MQISFGCVAIVVPGKMTRPAEATFVLMEKAKSEGLNKVV